MPHSFVYSLFVIFAGAAVISTLALFTRQSLLIAYMILGLILGPYGFHWIDNSEVVRRTGEIGIVFLLFLLGLDLPPQKLIHMFKKISWVGLVSSLLFFIMGFIISRLVGYSEIESYIIGSSMMFSSTIIGIKLLPSNVLHHQHTGDVMISVLLFQDILAIAVLTVLHACVLTDGVAREVVFVVTAFPCIIGFTFLFQRYVLVRLLKHFQHINEYLFLISIAWCLSMAELARVLHLSIEVGAFIAGVSLASSPIAVYIADSLRPIRDFFLVLFFFSVGASVDLTYFWHIAFYALLISMIFLVLKPIIYRFLLTGVSERKSIAWEAGTRLGQNSEFSLIIASVAFEEHLIGMGANTLIQAVTIMTFIISSYIVVLKYSTPVSMSERLKKSN